MMIFPVPAWTWSRPDLEGAEYNPLNLTRELEMTTWCPSSGSDWVNQHRISPLRIKAEVVRDGCSKQDTSRNLLLPLLHTYTHRERQASIT